MLRKAVTVESWSEKARATISEAARSVSGPATLSILKDFGPARLWWNLAAQVRRHGAPIEKVLQALRFDQSRASPAPRQS